MKTCTKCLRPFPATTEYFYPSKITKDGLLGDCLSCRKTYNRNWNAARTARRAALGKVKDIIPAPDVYRCICGKPIPEKARYRVGFCSSACREKCIWQFCASLLSDVSSQRVGKGKRVRFEFVG